MYIKGTKIILICITCEEGCWIPKEMFLKNAVFFFFFEVMQTIAK